MDKLKIFAALAIVPLFFACGSQDGSEAKIKNDGVLISPFDTLVVEFDSKITVKDLKTEGPAELVTTANSSNLKFVGTNKTKAELPYFEPNKNQEIVLSNIKNDDDYTKKEDIFTFKTMRILDDINEQSNNSKESAPDINSIGSLIDPEGVSFAGMLEHGISENNYNLQDFYSLKLVVNDSVNITFNVLQADTEVELIGVKDSVSWKAKKGENNFNYFVNCREHCTTGYVVGDEIQFYFRISDENANAGAPANPYKVTIGVKR